MKNITITLDLPQALKFRVQLYNLNIPFTSRDLGGTTLFNMRVKETLINIISEIIRGI